MSELITKTTAMQQKRSPLRVLHVTPFYPPDKGGIATHMKNLCSMLREDGNDITIIAPRRLRQPNSTDKKRIDVPSAYLPGWPYPTLRSMSIPLDFGRSIDSQIKSGKYDVVHAHGHHYPTTWMALYSAQKHGIPCVLTLHGMYALNPDVLGGRTRLEDWFNHHVFRRVLARTTAVIGLTRQITNFAKAYGTDETHYFTIANGVNSALYKNNITRKREFREKYGISQDALVISFVGRFERVKAVTEFANAAKHLIRNGLKAEFLMIGGGSLESEVQSIVEGEKQIHMLGWQPAELIHEFFIASDVFVSPSRFEALPLTVIEAMNAGLYIIYTPVGGVPDVLEGYGSKKVLKESTSSAIVDALKDVIEAFAGAHDRISPSLSAQMFDWKNIGLATTRVYEHITSKKT